MVLKAVGWLPEAHPSYAGITNQLLPVALGMLLLGVDFLALSRIGTQALIAMLVGALGIMLGGPVMLWLLQPHLPAEAWKGIGVLAATWTGGSLNMLALRTILDVPDSLFAPLVVVDALVAYSWMAFLIWCQGLSSPINRWLAASDVKRHEESIQNAPVSWNWQAASSCTAIAILLAILCRWLASLLPLGRFVATTTGWTVLLVTTAALILACVPDLRRLGQHGSSVGYPCLYVVLASLGAQASLRALATTPVWMLAGLGCLGCHAVALVLAGKGLRLPLGVLATASQANVGGVVSAPLVGAVYSQSLAPVGLVLALAGNAAGTYLGFLVAMVGRWITLA